VALSDLMENDQIRYTRLLVETEGGGLCTINLPNWWTVCKDTRQPVR